MFASNSLGTALTRIHSKSGLLEGESQQLHQRPARVNSLAFLLYTPKSDIFERIPL